jgi:hypothetical protein
MLGLSLRPGNRHHDAVGVAESRASWTIARDSAGGVGVGRRPGRWSRGQRRGIWLCRFSPPLSVGVMWFPDGRMLPPLVAGGGRPVCRAGRAADRAAAGPVEELSGLGRPARAAAATVVVRRGRLGSVAAVRKLVLSAMNCGARVFMADFEGGSPPVLGNLGHLNLRKALPREIVSSAPRACTQGNRRPGRGCTADGHRRPGMRDSGGDDAGPRRASGWPPTALPAR